MKNFLLNHPYIAGVITFLIVVVGGSFIGLLLGVWVITSSNSQPTSPSDPNDGAAMASGMILNLSIMASLTLGILAGLATTALLKSKQKP